MTWYLLECAHYGTVDDQDGSDAATCHERRRTVRPLDVVLPKKPARSSV